MAIAFVLFITNIYIASYIVAARTSARVITLGYKPIRPSYAGTTGSSYPQQLIPPGKPWPARPEDYQNFSVTSQKPAFYEKANATTVLSSTLDRSTLKPENEIVTSSKQPVPNKPPVHGSIEGSYLTEEEPSAKPWPTKPEDYASVTSGKPLPHEVTTETLVVEKDTLNTEHVVVEHQKLPVPNRPSFAGSVGSNYIPEIVPPGKPWPAKPEDYEGFSVTSQKPIQNGTTRPSPTRPEDYERPSVTSEKPLPHEVTTESLTINKDTLNPERDAVAPQKLPVPSRPSFAGSIGSNNVPETVPPGKPWPAKPEDYEGFSVTSQKPTSNEISSKPQNGAIVPQKLPNPNRPSSLGSTGGTYTSESVPPGKPWPARPEDYGNFSVTSQKPVTPEVATTPSVVYQGTSKPESNVSTVQKLPVTNNPSFLGENSIYESVPPGQPWPVKPENYDDFSVTSQKPASQESSVTASVIDGGNLKPENEGITTDKVSVLNLVSTESNYIPHIVSSAKPIPENHSSSTISEKPIHQEITTISSVTDQGVSKPENELTTSQKLPITIMPSSLGSEGMTSSKPARPDYLDNFVPTSSKPTFNEAHTVSSVANKTTLEPENEVIASQQLQLATSSPGNVPEKGSTMKPGPTKPEEEEDISIASHQPVSQEGINESNSEYVEKPQNEGSTPQELSIPNAPPFLESGFISEKVPSEKPWSAKPEDYEGCHLNAENLANAPSKIPVSNKPALLDTDTLHDTSIYFAEDRGSKTPMTPTSSKSPNIATVFFYLDLGKTNSASDDTRLDRLKLSTQKQNTDIPKKASLAISFNVDAFRVGGESIPNNVEKLERGKVSNFVQNNSLSVSLNLGDLINSPKKYSAARFNVGHILGTNHVSGIASEKIESHSLIEEGSPAKSEQDSSSAPSKSPLLSIFVNLEDFRKVNKDSIAGKRQQREKSVVRKGILRKRRRYVMKQL